LFGVDYIAQFVTMEYNREEEEFAYKVYLTEFLRLYGENKRLTVSFREIVRPEPEQPMESPEEIKAKFRAEFERIGGAARGT